MCCGVWQVIFAINFLVKRLDYFMFDNSFLLDRSLSFSCDFLFEASRFKLTFVVICANMMTVLESFLSKSILWFCPPWTHWSERVRNNFGNAVVMLGTYFSPPSKSKQLCTSFRTKLVERKFAVPTAFSIFVWNSGRQSWHMTILPWIRFGFAYLVV